MLLVTSLPVIEHRALRFSLGLQNRDTTLSSSNMRIGRDGIASLHVFPANGVGGLVSGE